VNLIHSDYLKVDTSRPVRMFVSFHCIVANKPTSIHYLVLQTYIKRIVNTRSILKSQ